MVGSWEVKDFAHSGIPVTRKSCHFSGPSPMRPNDFWTCLDMELPGLCLCLSTVWVAGLLEEKEEGIGIVSDVKMKDKHLPPPDCLREDRVRRYAGDSEKETWVRAPLARWGNPGTVTIPQYWVLKQSNTHTCQRLAKTFLENSFAKSNLCHLFL